MRTKPEQKQMHSEGSRKKISAALVGYKVSNETRKKMSEAQKGKKMSKVAREKISEFRLGKSRSEDVKKKISKKMTGRSFSEARKRRQRYLWDRRRELREAGVTTIQLHSARLDLEVLRQKFEATERADLPSVDLIELENAEIEVRVIERLIAAHAVKMQS